MEKNSVFNPQGFTLAEIVISLLLLSILTVGSFKTFHLVQSTTNSNLLRFKKVQTDQQLSVLQRLNQTYQNISADNDFDELACLIQARQDCP